MLGVLGVLGVLGLGFRVSWDSVSRVIIKVAVLITSSNPT